MLTAAPGLGKTTLVDELADELGGEGYPVGKVASTQVDADDLLKLVGFAFGLEADAFGKAQLLNGLKRLVGGERRGPGPALLIVDEAHHLPASALEELKLLRNLAADGEPIRQILLCGQERLWETLHLPECELIRQLILGSASLSPLSAGETRDYIGHALLSTGWAGDPEIGADALRLLNAHTRGVPRLINRKLAVPRSVSGERPRRQRYVVPPLAPLMRTSGRLATRCSHYSGMVPLSL